MRHCYLCYTSAFGASFMPRFNFPPIMPCAFNWVNSLPCGVLTIGLTLTGTIAIAPRAIGQTSEPSNQVDLNATPAVVNGRISRPTLQPGSQGEAVLELQSVLTLLGYYSGPLSGVFQDTTQVAVQQFQTDAGINPDGIVGPATWSSLFPAPPSEANPPGTAVSSTPQNATTTPNTPASTSQGTTAEPSTSPQAPPSPSSPPAPSTNSGSQARPVLRLGDRGAAVSQLQQLLQKLDFYNGPIDGIFGSQLPYR